MQSKKTISQLRFEILTKNARFYRDQNANGTERYYMHNDCFNIWSTDGIKNMCYKLKCDWLLDVIVNNYDLIKEQNKMLRCEILHDTKTSVIFYFLDGLYNIIKEQKIENIELDFDVILYIAPHRLDENNCKFIIMLPTEY